MTAPDAMTLPFTRAQRLRLYWLRDHGVIRALWHNFHRLDEEVWRHNHPSPARLAHLHALGAASILSLRGPEAPVSRIEAAACAAVGLEFHAVKLRATGYTRKAPLIELMAALRAMPKPLVIHCKSGSDRTGLAATLYLHAIKGVPLATARRQLALRHLHLPFGRALVIHRMLDAYAASGLDFDTWLSERYDPIAMAETDAKTKTGADTDTT